VSEVNFDLQRLRFERLSRRVSQEEMAKALGVTRPTYYKKESGQIKISVDEFATILDTLGIPHQEAGNFFKRFVPKREQKVAR
jgi:transcriptional regulator with XRE-family HTH domain